MRGRALRSHQFVAVGSLQRCAGWLALIISRKPDRYILQNLGSLQAFGGDEGAWRQMLTRDPHGDFDFGRLGTEIIGMEGHGFLLNTQRLMRGVNKFYCEGLNSLRQWRDLGRKDTVSPLGRANLNEALSQVLNEERQSRRHKKTNKLEGSCESVQNARWSRGVEVPGGEGMGMEVKEGEPPQPWTYKKVGLSLEKDDGVQQSGAERLRLMVLTSDKGWPYSWKWKENKSTHDCYVNCEVERVWRIVLGDLTEWFNSHGRTDFKPKQHLLIGTSGIGKSMAVGSYLLYQLLHYDAEKLPVVVHCFGETTYLFDKTIKTVTRYLGSKTSRNVLYDLRHLKMKGYVIYNVTEKGMPASCFAPCGEWGMIVLSSPNVGNYEKWETQVRAERIIVNCPDEMDMKAMCAWMKRGLDPDKQAEYWKEVKERMEKLGPILRYIFDANKFIAHSAAIEDALDGINSRDGRKELYAWRSET
ncbi:retrotransposon hot spot protein (RHS), partial [Trypanosoma cruzi]